MPRLTFPFFMIGRHGAFCLVGLALLLAACGSAPKRDAAHADKPQTSAPISKPGYYMDDGPGANPPGNLMDIPDAVPRQEPLHKGANRPYTVFGKTYVPNVSNEPFKQTGIASWYGRKFHGLKTSIGETYDMYAMTAAHPTLPLPCYVRVTNVATGKSVVVRVNDRGPFLHNRVIDLSYAAASRIGIAGPGSGKVIVERLFPGELIAASPSRPASRPDPQANAPIATPVPIPPPIQAQPLTPPTPISTEPAGIFIQLGAFGSLENAEGFRDKMVRDLSWMREPITVAFKDGLQRVRIGPLANREEAEAIASKVRETHDLPLIISKP